MTKLSAIAIEGARRGDTASRDAVMAAMAPIVKTAARRFSNSSTTPREDLEQDCWLAIFEALETYDPDKGSFETWCYGPMRFQMRSTAAELMAGPTVPSVTASRYFSSLARGGEVEKGTMSAVHTAVSSTFSISAFSDSDADRIDIPSSMDDFELPASSILIEQLMDRGRLSDREKFVLRCWSGMETGEPMTDSEIAEVEEVARTMTQKIRYRALEKMREGVREYDEAQD